MIPASAAPDIKAALASILTRLDRFDGSGNIDLSGRRIINAGKAIGDFDYVTKFDLDKTIASLDLGGADTGTGGLTQAFFYGTHAQRVTKAPNPNGAVFVETDRYAIYQARDVSGVRAWVLAGGSFDPKGDNLASRPGDLGTNDAQYYFFAKDNGVQYRWTGSAWKYNRGLYINTFSNRPTFGDADTNFLFAASDRGYQVWYAGASAWTVLEGVGGPMRGTLSPDTKPTLGADDVGFLFRATDFGHDYRWSGSAWTEGEASPTRGVIAYWDASNLPPPSGLWALCDGSVVTRSTGSGGTASYTTPNLTGSNRFIRSVSGTTLGTGGSATTHTHPIDPPNTTSTGPSTVTTGNNSASQEVQSGTGVTVAAHTHTHDRSETHDVNIASFTSGTPSGTSGDDALPPYLNLQPYVRL